jgi:DNA-binding Lrp family transcriptional regulator
MDRIDLKIIELLLPNSDMPFSEVAKKLDLGVDTVIRRYYKLKNDGIIDAATVTVDLKKCGYEGHALFLVNTIAGADLKKMCAEFAKISNLLCIVHTIGDYDLILHGIYSDIDAVTKLQKEISMVPGIKQMIITCISAKTFMTNYPTVEYYLKAFARVPIDCPV